MKGRLHRRFIVLKPSIAKPSEPLQTAFSNPAPQHSPTVYLQRNRQLPAAPSGYGKLPRLSFDGQLDQLNAKLQDIACVDGERDLKEALRLWKQFEELGVQKTVPSYVYFMQILASEQTNFAGNESKRKDLGFSVLHEMRQGNLKFTSSVLNYMLKICLICKDKSSSQIVWSLFDDQSSKKNALSYLLMMKNCSLDLDSQGLDEKSNSDVSRMLTSLLWQMVDRQKIPPNSELLTFLLLKTSQMKDVELSKKIFQLYDRFNIQRSAFEFDRMLKSYFHGDDIPNIEEVKEFCLSLIALNTVANSNLILTLLKISKIAADASFSYKVIDYVLRFESSVHFDTSTYTSLLAGLSFLMRNQPVEEVSKTLRALLVNLKVLFEESSTEHQEIPGTEGKSSLICDSKCAAAMIKASLFFDYSLVKVMWKFSDRFPQSKSIDVFTSLFQYLGKLCDNRRSKFGVQDIKYDLMSYLEEAESLKIPFDKPCIHVLLGFCRSSKDIILAKEFWKYFDSFGVEEDLESYNLLFSTYKSCMGPSTPIEVRVQLCREVKQLYKVCLQHQIELDSRVAVTLLEIAYLARNFKFADLVFSSLKKNDANTFAEYFKILRDHSGDKKQFDSICSKFKASFEMLLNENIEVTTNIFNEILQTSSLLKDLGLVIQIWLKFCPMGIANSKSYCLILEFFIENISLLTSPDILALKQRIVKELAAETSKHLLNSELMTNLIRLSRKSSDFVAAKQYWESLSVLGLKKNVEVCTEMIRVCSAVGKFSMEEDARLLGYSIYDSVLKSAEMPPTSDLLNAVLELASIYNDSDKVRDLWQSFVTLGLVRTDVSYSIMESFLYMKQPRAQWKYDNFGFQSNAHRAFGSGGFTS